MILFFGAPGAGKSVQGQLLATQMGWRWLSAGKLLRETGDPELLAEMKSGELVDPHKVNAIMGEAFKRAADIDEIILDGFPRMLEQAKWLIEQQPEHEHSIGVVFVLDVPAHILMERLAERGRLDDTASSIEERLEIYHREVTPILDYFASVDVPIVHIDGSGAVNTVHAQIVDALQELKLV
jgi:adenylate kinase